MTPAPTIISHPAQITPVAAEPGSSATEEGSHLSPSLYSLIAEQPFFKGLNSQQLQLLTESAMVMQFEPGQAIFEDGSPANRFHLILEGQVVLESELEDRSLIPIQTLGPGDELGWSWLFPPYSLHSNARALVATRTIFFYGTRLREQCEQDHDLGYELMKRTAEVLIQRLRAMQQRLMESTRLATPTGNAAPPTPAPDLAPPVVTH